MVPSAMSQRLEDEDLRRRRLRGVGVAGSGSEASGMARRRFSFI